MGRSASASDRWRLAIGAVAFAAPIAACRLFVELDGLGGGTAVDATTADTSVGQDVTADGDRDVTHPSSVDAASIIDASDDVPQFDVDASTPCPGIGGPTPVRVPTSTGSFCIDSTEVTRDQYQTFLATLPSTANQGAFCGWNASFAPTIPWPPAAGELNLPIGGVDWCDAQAFCKWAGKRLCGAVGGGVLTVAASTTLSSQVVFACTGAGTRAYPYGNTYGAEKCMGGETLNAQLELVKSRPDCQLYGVYDLAGNAHEWIDACVVTSMPEADQCVHQSSAYDGHPEADMACNAMGTSGRSEASAAVSFRCCSD